MLDLTILGSAASSPTPERSLPAIAVRIDGDVLLLDCGEGTQRQMMKLGVSYSKVQAIFVSHLHLDHYLGIFGLMETLRLNGRTQPVKLFGPPGSARVFARSKLLDIHEIEPSSAKLKKPLFTINGHDVYAFPVEHGAGEHSFGFSIVEQDRRRFHESKAHAAGLKGPMFSEIQKKGSLKVGAKVVKLDDISYIQPGKKLVYSGDTTYCKSLVKAAEDADLLIHDSTFSEEERELADERSHATAADAARAAKEANAKQLLLFHIGGRFHSPEPLLEEAKKVFPHTSAAEDGMKISL
ncbi:Ribonuclease Z [uncultured archaeon]|nr:Ribonuclease Z [uncultured archaeon]